MERPGIFARTGTGVIAGVAAAAVCVPIWLFILTRVDAPWAQALLAALPAIPAAIAGGLADRWAWKRDTAEIHGTPLDDAAGENGGGAAAPGDP